MSMNISIRRRLHKPPTVSTSMHGRAIIVWILLLSIFGYDDTTWNHGTVFAFKSRQNIFNTNRIITGAPKQNQKWMNHRIWNEKSEEHLYRQQHIINIRGGSTATAVEQEEDTEMKSSNDDKKSIEKEQKEQELQEQRQKYLLQQQLLLSSRSLQLRQALISRGINELQHTTPDTSTSAAATKIPIDWECAISTNRNPKSCLYSFDAEIGTKVIAPTIISTTTNTNNDNNNNSDNKKKNQQQQQYQWITLSSLNRLRRTDSSKIEPLWHNQYSILLSWFTRNGIYSIYQHFNPITSIVSYILDEPIVLLSSLIFAISLLMLITIPIWEYIFIRIISSNTYLWKAWPHWSRFVHAALPLQLLMAQMSYRFIESLFLSLYRIIRNQLIEYECYLYEQCIPLTIIDE